MTRFNLVCTEGAMRDGLRFKCDFLSKAPSEHALEYGEDQAKRPDEAAVRPRDPAARDLVARDPNELFRRLDSGS